VGGIGVGAKLLNLLDAILELLAFGRISFLFKSMLTDRAASSVARLDDAVVSL
jgi:hypothetical protein